MRKIDFIEFDINRLQERKKDIHNQINLLFSKINKINERIKKIKEGDNNAPKPNTKQ